MRKRDGRIETVAVLGPGDFFGEMALEPPAQCMVRRARRSTSW
ncbi:MAG: hypothetical protein U0166_14670 [Acidobacteriota bacterium]